MIASLKQSGTSASARDLLMMAVIVGSNTSRQSLVSDVGRGSRAQVVDAEDVIILRTSCSVVGCRMER